MILLTVLFAVCVSGCNESAQTPASAGGVAGRWRLQSVADGTPSAVNIKQYEAEFLSDGTWRYEATMAGPFVGTRMKCSGTWKLDGPVLEYSAGDNTGRTRVTISGRVLTFSPDPVVMPDGKTPVTTRYERSQ